MFSHKMKNIAHVFTLARNSCKTVRQLVQYMLLINRSYNITHMFGL